MQVVSTSGNVIRRAGLVLGMAWTAASGCAARQGRRTSLSPPPTPVELGLAAQALEDSSIGPFFPPGLLHDGVRLLRSVYHKSPINTMPSSARELSWHPSLQFRMTDTLFKRLFGVRPDPPGGFVNRWLDPPRIGLPVFDSITAAMGGAVAIQAEGLPCCGFLTVYYREAVNVPAVARAYARLEPAVTISPFQGLLITTDDIADRIRIEAGDTVWTVRLPAGWGDCPKRPDRRPCEFKYRPATGRLVTFRDRHITFECKIP